VRDTDCEDRLKREKTAMENLRYLFSLMVTCPKCAAPPGKDCALFGDPERLAAAFEAVRKLQGSQYGES
jgi:hypothetical protein